LQSWAANHWFCRQLTKTPRHDVLRAPPRLFDVLPLQRRRNCVLRITLCYSGPSFPQHLQQFMSIYSTNSNNMKFVNLSPRQISNKFQQHIYLSTKKTKNNKFPPNINKIKISYIHSSIQCSILLFVSIYKYGTAEKKINIYLLFHHINFTLSCFIPSK